MLVFGFAFVFQKRFLVDTASGPTVDHVVHM